MANYNNGMGGNFNLGEYSNPWGMDLANLLAPIPGVTTTPAPLQYRTNSLANDALVLLSNSSLSAGGTGFNFDYPELPPLPLPLPLPLPASNPYSQSVAAAVSDNKQPDALNVKTDNKKEKEPREITTKDQIRNAARSLSSKNSVIKNLDNVRLDLPREYTAVPMEQYDIVDYDGGNDIVPVLVAKNLTNEFVICINGKIEGRKGKKGMLRFENYATDKRDNPLKDEILHLMKGMKERLVPQIERMKIDKELSSLKKAEDVISYTISIIGGQHPDAKYQDSGDYAVELAFLKNFKKPLQKELKCTVDQILFNPTTAGTKQVFSVVLGHNIQVSNCPLTDGE